MALPSVLADHDHILLGVMGRRYRGQLKLWRLNRQDELKYPVTCGDSVVYPDAYIMAKDAPDEKIALIVELEPAEFDINTQCDGRWVPLSRVAELHLFVPKIRLRECTDALADRAQSIGRIVVHVWYLDAKGFHVEKAG